MYTTLNKIHSYNPCKRGWDTLLAYLGKTEPDDEPLPVLTILNSNGLDDALWALRAVDGHEQAIRAFSLWCVARVRHLIRDPALSDALATAERYVLGLASEEERAKAHIHAIAVASRSELFGSDSLIAVAVWCAMSSCGYGFYVDAAAHATARALDFPREREAQEAELRRILAETSAVAA